MHGSAAAGPRAWTGAVCTVVFRTVCTAALLAALAACRVGPTAQPGRTVVAPPAQPETALPRPDSDHTRRSGYDFMSPATQALQRDDSLNPGMLWVQGGKQRFEADCKACHTPADLSGAAPRYPAFDAVLGKPSTLAGRINTCRQRHLRQPPWPWDSEPLLELEAFVALQARGLPLQPVDDPRLHSALQLGRRLWLQPLGQLQLSCAQCHDQQAGQRLAGSTIPQAHATGYPLYRLEWQALGPLQRRLRGCMNGVRADAFAYGAEEWVALELWLRQRAAGMVLEAPAVRP
jgi:L-cysteine S-thiosulfotransferase